MIAWWQRSTYVRSIKAWSLIIAIILIGVPSTATGAASNEPRRVGVSQQAIQVGPGPDGICLNTASGKTYVACNGDDTVAVIDNQHINMKTIPVGPRPRSVDANVQLNKIYVSNEEGNSISVINGVTDTVIKTTGVGASPLGVAVNQATAKIYVVNSDDKTVSVLNGLTDSVARTISVGADSSFVTVNSLTNKIYVTNGHDNAVTVIDGTTDTVVGFLRVGQAPCGIAVNEVSNKVYVANASDDSVSVIDGKTDAVGARIWIDGIWTHEDSQPYQVCVNEVTNSVYVSLFKSGEVAVINGGSDTLKTCFWGGVNPMGLVVDPASGKVYVADSYSGTVSVLDDSTHGTFYFAEGTCRPGFDPYICIQNPGSLPADVKIAYMRGDSTTAEQSLRIGPQSRATAHPVEVLGCGDDIAHDFSARVECTNGQAIVAERPMYFNYKGKWTGGHDVIGATGSNMQAYFAEGSTRPGFEPYVCMQNPNDQGTYVDVIVGDINKEMVLAPHSRSTVSVVEMMGVGDDSAHDFGIAVQSGTSGGSIPQPVIVERPIYFDYHGVWTGGTDIVGTPSPSTAYYFAEGTTRPDFDTYLCLSAYQHEAKVKITYMRGDGSTREQEVSVSTRTTINCRDILGTGDDASHDFSTKVESTNGEPIVVERPMYFNYKGVWTGGHDVLGTSSPSKTFYFAEGSTRSNFETYYCIQNPDATPAAVRITYMKGNGDTREQDVEVPAHSRVTVICSDFLGSADDAAHDFSAKVECTNGRKIVVERPMYFNYGGAWSGGHDVVGYQE